jgi:uncharacterized MAPEG superfamily protein
MTAVQALLAFTAWTILLVLCIAAYRMARLAGGTSLAAWSRGKQPADVPGLITRLEHAHANCVENLPLFGAVVLGALAMNRLDAIAGMATLVVCARLAQSLTHLSGAGGLQVLVRGTFWTIQLVLFLMMGMKIIA